MESELARLMRSDRLRYTKLHTINNCVTKDFDSIEALLACAKVGTTDSLDLEIYIGDQRKNYLVSKSSVTSKFEPNLTYMAIDSILLLLSLCLSFLLFIKGRRYISGYLLSLALLTSACERYIFSQKLLIINTGKAYNSVSLFFV